MPTVLPLGGTMPTKDSTPLSGGETPATRSPEKITR
jgi:hypothetical protein